MKRLTSIITLSIILLSCNPSTNGEYSDNKEKLETPNSNEVVESTSPYIITYIDIAGQDAVDKIEIAITEKGLTIFNEIPHHEGAANVGEELHFTHLIIFGNPKVGTKLMQCDQNIGIELPLKILVSTTSDGRTQISYKNPQHFAEHFNMEQCEEILNKMEKLIEGITNLVE